MVADRLGTRPPAPPERRREEVNHPDHYGGADNPYESRFGSFHCPMCGGQHRTWNFLSTKYLSPT